MDLTYGDYLDDHSQGSYWDHMNLIVQFLDSKARCTQWEEAYLYDAAQTHALELES